MMIMDYDKNMDGKFSADEVALFKKDVFDTLEPMSYYTHLNCAGKKIKIKDLIKDFNIDQKKSRFIVKYTLNLQKLKDQKKISIGFWDEDFYSSFMVKRKYIKIDDKNIKYKIKDVDGDFFMGQAVELEL